MELIVKSLAGLFSLVGGCCAVVIPLSMYLSSSSEVVDEQISGGGVESSDKAISLKTCPTSEVEEDNVPFGTSSEKSLCGRVIDVSEDQLEEERAKESLTSLFKRMGKDRAGNGNAQTDSSWATQCLNGAKGWVLSKQGEGKEYLGYCQNSSPTENKNTYLEVEKKAVPVGSEAISDSIGLKICWANCGKDIGTGELKQYSNKEEQNGKTVKFVKLSKF